jgi:DNA-binding transcriptional MerR regulator
MSELPGTAPIISEEKLYYTIGEVSALLNVNSSLLRYWESEFPHIRPKTNRKGDRRYKATDIENIKVIYKLVKEQGYTLQGAKEFLQKKVPGKHQDVIERLSEIKAFMAGMKEWLIEQQGKAEEEAQA